jgi:uncharacterized repeat protein (TIGR03806 family)
VSRAKPSSSFIVLLILSSAAAASVGGSGCDETLPRELTPPPPAARFDARPANATCLAPAVPPGRVRLEPAFTGFYRPLAMVDRPERGLVYVAEMPGRVKVLDRATGQTSVALDLVGKVGTYFEQGLLGLALHPTKPWAYVTVERDADATSRKDLPVRAEILRFTVSADGKSLDPASEKLVLRIDRPSTLHYPGTLLFGKDGFLYIGVGDGGRDVPKYPTDSLLGSILRIDVDSAEPYAIPADNPFVGGVGGGMPEVFAGGFRNPWRFTMDRVTGELWAGDVGSEAFEEIDRVERGKNYGWPTVEGNTCARPRVDCDRTGLTAPAFVYPHAEGASVTGGYVYRGTAMPDLVGKYVFGDFVVGRIWALEGTSDNPTTTLLNSGGVKPSLSSFGEDASGELYALDWESGTIFKLVPGEAEPASPYAARLSETGCVDRADPRKAAPGLVPYGVNVPLWSDGADKQRFVAIPDGTTIDIDEAGDFALPERSVAMKTFSIGGKRIETRLLFRHAGDEWTGVTYEWNDAETEATLLETGKDKVLANGQTWQFPSRAQCFVCHTKAAGRSLGLEALQLNGDFGYTPGQIENQLGKLADIGYLARRLDLATQPGLPALLGSAPVQQRARAYLHANCSMCHREGAGTGATLDFRFDVSPAAAGVCRPAAFPGVADAQAIAPGDPARSTILLRMKDRESYQMPPLSTKRVDNDAIGVIEAWARSVTTCE